MLAERNHRAAREKHLPSLMGREDFLEEAASELGLGGWKGIKPEKGERWEECSRWRA